MDMLHITDLHKSFGDKKVLCGVNLSVPEHSIYGFIGKNGAGKTTLMKTVLGLLKADFGEITVNGEKGFYCRPVFLQGVYSSSKNFLIRAITWSATGVTPLPIPQVLAAS